MRTIFVLTLSVVFATLASADSSAWKAGVARQKITPPKPMWMAGYASRSHVATGTAHDLWAKALVLQDPSGERSVLVTLDLSGIGRVLSVEICTALQKTHSLNRSQIAISTSHTHSGPVVGRVVRSMYFFDEQQEALVASYTDFLFDQIGAAVADAMAAIEPVEISFGSANTDIAVNRRNNPEAEVPALRESGELAGPVDHSVPVLKVSTDSGQLSAIVFGYACHATVVSRYEWSGDWPGYAQIEIEKRHPGSIAMFVAGCGADQNPLPRRTVELSEGYGRRMAAAVDNALSGEMAAVTGPLTTEYEEIAIPFGRIPSRADLEKELNSSNKYYASRAKMLLSQLDSTGKLDDAYEHYPVQVWAIGTDACVVFLGGEVVVDYSIRLRDEFPDRNLWVASYSNDVMAYIPSERVLSEGGYEGGGAMVYFGLPGPWAPGIEQTIVDTVQRTVHRVDRRSE